MHRDLRCLPWTLPFWHLLVFQMVSPSPGAGSSWLLQLCPSHDLRVHLLTQSGGQLLRSTHPPCHSSHGWKLLEDGASAQFLTAHWAEPCKRLGRVRTSLGTALRLSPE